MKLSLRVCCGALFGATFVYNTPKFLRVRSVKIGLANRLIQIFIVVYVIGYAIIYKKGYQETDDAQSSVTTKVKGIASTLDDKSLPPEYRRVWDTPEFVPSQENGAFFVLTNAIVTPDQKLGTCAEDANIKPCNVSNPAEACVPGAAVENGNGIMTGICLKSISNITKASCEIRAWCPLERRKLLLPDRPLLPDAENFTVFIKNNIEFPNFKIKLNNVKFEQNNEFYLKTCRNNPDDKNARHCPVFKLGDIVKHTDRKGRRNYFREIAVLGGVINIAIKWDCNFDHDYDKCTPRYDFSRLDYPPVPISLGYNFRYAKYYQSANKTERRDLIKAYGILFIITVEGKAGKFHIVPLAFNIGAGVGLLGLATVLTDLVLLYLSSNREQYTKEKFTKITGKEFMKIKKKLTKKSSTTEKPGKEDAPLQNALNDDRSKKLSEMV